MGSIDRPEQVGGQLATINIASLLDLTASTSSRDATIEELRKACVADGFFVVTGHGIPLNLQHQVLGNAEKFFDLPLEQKQAVSIANAMGMAYRGYEQMHGQVIEVGGHPDLKEGFIVGSEIAPSDSRAGQFLLGPNQWPTAMKNQEFEQPLMEYHKQAAALMEVLLKALTATVPQYLTEAKTKELMDQAESTLRLLHYPPKNPEVENQFGAAAHADVSLFTVLLQQEGVPGLQIYLEVRQTWIAAPAHEDALVVNVGNVLQTLTDGYFKSARHRVMNPEQQHRYSAPLFYYGNLDVEFTPTQLTADALPSQGKVGLVVGQTTTVGKYIQNVIQAVQSGG